MCPCDGPLISPCDTRHVVDSDRLLPTLVWTHWNQHEQKEGELASVTVTAILIQTTCVARKPCLFPGLSHVRPSHFSPMTSTSKTQLMRRRRETKRDCCSHLRNTWRLRRSRILGRLVGGGSVKGHCRLCDRLGLKMIASSRLLKVQASARRTPGTACCAALFVESRRPPLCWADVPLWSPLDARCVLTPVPFMLIQELVLQLVSDDTVGAWPRWADGRDELAITVEGWEHVGMSSKEPLSAAFSLWGRHRSLSTLGSTV